MSRAKRGDQTVAIESAVRSVPVEGAWLVVAPGTPEEQRIAVQERPMVIGKGPTADILISDPTVSKRHAEIRRTPSGVQLIDLGSRNGTKVNGIAVHGALLDTGVTVTVGRSKLRFECDTPLKAANQPTRFGEAMGRSPGMRQVFSLLERIAPTDLTITILGETGTGKDVLARAVHKNSSRRNGPFVVFDCGAVAPTLIESQLFGHQKGAFTGAVDTRAGAFEMANGGTLFLDEIGELALDLQPKLLRVLEQRRLSRVGGEGDIGVDVRVIAATNRDLEREVQAGRFREDLYFRLSTAVVRLPPLRERQDDLVDLATHFAREQGGVGVSQEAMNIICAYDWPGNVRELRNVIAGAVAVVEGPELTAKDFVFFRKRRREPTLEGLPLAGRSLESIERTAIRQTLNECEGNKTQAAKALGIAPSTLYAKIKKYELE
jgi:DNA-binding NtrC family response regulator